jgi:hypothetical protein
MMADHEPEIVGYMIKYLYTGDYTIIKPDIDAAKQPLESSENTPTSIEPPKNFFWKYVWRRVCGSCYSHSYSYSGNRYLSGAAEAHCSVAIGG